ncbi:DNA mismatch repair protein MutL [Planctomycetales bacterium]|nr:DNA mismatch repair protein MutL [Planctomycetales bacterium]
MARPVPTIPFVRYNENQLQIFKMPTIHQLSQSMINKIAAGEVIERPASVVKELVENAVDAGATRIDLAIENGGADLVRIVDNGCGIAADQLELALSPHATSKIADTDDLFKIATFGFRGEALASIAEISQMTLKSRTADNPEGAFVQCYGGERKEPQSCGLPVGTQIDVRNLFFNTPVRRKYMRTVTTEFGHITETFFRLVLPLPQIHFTLKHNGRTVYDLPAANGANIEHNLDRIRQLFGEEIARDLIAVGITQPPQGTAAKTINVTGFVSHPNFSRPNNRLQYFFLNHRFIRDRSLQHALNEAYRGLLLGGRFPAAFLHVELPTELFDVNVHPTKMEVRFLDSNRIYSSFLGAIREQFLLSDLRNPVHSDTVPPPIDPLAPSSAVDKNVRNTVIDWMSKIESANKNPAAVASGTRTAMPSGTRTSERTSMEFHRLPPTSPLNPPSPPRAAVISNISEPMPFADRISVTPSGHLAVQMLDRYIIMETDGGIVIIDQHALHERILYEQMKERINAGRLESQRLLVPVPVDLPPNDFAASLENAAFFKTLGLDVEAFGGNTVLISAFPAILSKTPPHEILLTMLDSLPNRSASTSTDTNTINPANHSAIIDDMLHQLACKAAVKAGDKINSASMRRLLELAQEEVQSHHCPHGRPSTLVFTVEEIDKMFNRT